MAEEKRVFDIAKPGKSKPTIGSKPMVVGHKYISADPTLTPDNTLSNDSAEPERTIKVTHEKVLTPKPELQSKSEKENTETVAKKAEESQTDKQEPTTTATDNAQEAPVGQSEDSQDGIKDEEPNEKKDISSKNNDVSDENLDADDLQVQRETQLQALLKTNKYHVPVKGAKTASIKTFFITFSIVILLGLLVLALLIDAEILDVGISMPFNLL